VTQIQRKAAIKRVDTIILLVNNIEKSVRFYRDKIGMSLKFKSPGWAEFVIGDVHLALHRNDSKTPEDCTPQVPAGVSVNVEVDDIDEMLVRLAALGINPVGGIKQYEFGRYFFTVDPDGYIIGFREYRNDRPERLPS
jgi:catechol 2,3-dioxygenase-like lactoylglutathione lyase family enzyme